MHDNASNVLTAGDYGSGAMYDLVHDNITSTAIINYIAPQTTGQTNTFYDICIIGVVQLFGYTKGCIQV